MRVPVRGVKLESQMVVPSSAAGAFDVIRNTDLSSPSKQTGAINPNP